MPILLFLALWLFPATAAACCGLNAGVDVIDLFYGFVAVVVAVLLWRFRDRLFGLRKAPPKQLAGRHAAILKWMRTLAKFGFLGAIVLMGVAFGVSDRGGGYDILLFFAAITLLGISLGGFAVSALLAAWFSRGGP